MEGATRKNGQRRKTNLHKRALDFAVRAGALREAPAADGVDLVHEDHARLVVLRVPCDWRVQVESQSQQTG